MSFVVSIVAVQLAQRLDSLAMCSNAPLIAPARFRVAKKCSNAHVSMCMMGACETATQRCKKSYRVFACVYTHALMSEGGGIHHCILLTE